ncbi:glycoside hydrolase family 43 protein [Oleiharenicola lentus]|uniref:glycoside hydrolase family 43 protein n=1 Tax=Oleiharenicola lentus TaxID=2508720 RepID=UPI003F67D123
MASLSLIPVLNGNPQGVFRPGEIWPDKNGVAINAHGGGILEHQGVYYWFGEHKIEGQLGNLAMVGVHVYSSPDLFNWSDQGIALPVSCDPNSEIAPGCVLERPKVIYNALTKKFVMWFHLELRSAGYTAARAGVAVADSPTGPYHYLGSFRANAGVWPANTPEGDRKALTAEETALVNARKFHGGPFPNFPHALLWRRDFEGGQMARDMTLFVDDDGTAWHVYASEENSTLHFSRLTDDYLRPAGDYVRVFPGEFREAPTIMKREGKYYLFTSGCTGWKPNPLKVAVADSIRGPWIDLGNPCEGSDDEQKTTFSSQPTFILPLKAKGADHYIFMADRWRPDNAIDGRHVWLPLQFRNTHPVIRWHESWNLNAFEN